MRLRGRPTSRHRAESSKHKLVRANEEMFRFLVSNVQDYAIFMLDPDGRVASWNEGAARIKGAAADEIIGESYSRFFTPEDIADGKPGRLLDEARRTGRVEDQGWRVRKDGSKFLANFILTRLTDTAGRLIGFAKITRDITEHVRAQEAERERAAREQTQIILDRVQAFAANLPGLAYRRVLKRDGSVEYPFVAGEYLELLGFATNPALENGADLLSITHPDDRARLREALKRSARDMKPLEIEARMVFVSGDVRWMRSRSSPRRGSDGAIVWDAIAFDVTEQRRLEQHLRLLQSTSLAVAEAEDFNAALLVVIQSVCGATGWDYGETWIPDINNTKLKLGPVWHGGDSRLGALEEFSRSLTIAPGEGVVGTAWQSRKLLWVPDLAAWFSHSRRTHVALTTGINSFSAVPIIAGNDLLAIMSFATWGRREYDAGLASTMGTVANQLGSALFRKRTEQALREKEGQLGEMQKMKAIGSLTGGMAHDFNNLLGVVIGNLDLLGEIPDIGEETRTLANDALGAALRGADLIRRLLAFARQQPLQPEQFNVGEHVTEIAILLGRTLGEDIEIRLDIDREAWLVLADRTQLESAITNLATNARDAMPNGGRLTISVAKRHLDQEYANTHPDVLPGDYTMIAVSDTGTGILPDVMDHLFEPFFTTKEPGKGTGLGLSMVFGFIKQSGGHVSVYTEPGVGTTFRLYLPRAKAGSAQIKSETGPEESIRGTGELILAVEDNAELRQVLERQLRELGYRPLFAENARGALELLERNEDIRMLFTDIVMPGGMSGLELAREASARWPWLRVLLTSGFPEAGVAKARFDGTEPRLLSKPYRKDELGRALRHALHGDR